MFLPLLTREERFLAWFSARNSKNRNDALLHQSSTSKLNV